MGIITGPSYHFTRRGLPYINRLREHNSRSEDNDLSAGVEVAGGLPHRSRSHSPCSISSESESQVSGFPSPESFNLKLCKIYF